MSVRRNDTRDAGRRCLVTLILLSGLQPATAEVPNDVIGRLFLPPAERARIELARGREDAMDVSFTAIESGQKVERPDESVALNGVVRRADGNDVIWVNGRMIGDRLGDAETIKVRQGPDANNNVVLEASGVPRPVRLKPGQAWDRDTGSVVDCYRCTRADTEPAANEVAEPADDE